MPNSSPLTQRLRQAAIPQYARRVLDQLHANGHPAYLVGGCVRDLLRGAAPKDYDVTTRARPEVVLGLFPKTVGTGLQHGTVTVVEPEGLVEVTTFRGEGDYTDGRRPDAVTFLDDVRGDLARRDFTINAMAFDPTDDALVDPFGGIDDLERRTVRCVGRAADRFAEDGLRPLRAVRFASVLRFELDGATQEAIGPAHDTYTRVAVERIADELRKLLTGPRPERGLSLLVDTGLSGRVLPALAQEPPSARRHRFRRVSFTPRVHAQRLAALFWGHASALAALKPSGALLRSVEAVERLHEPLAPGSTDAALRRFASRAGPNLHHALVLQRAELLASGPREAVDAHRRTRSRLRALLSGNPPLQISQLAVGGDDVARALGATGPHIGQALRRVLDAVLDDPSLNTREALIQMLTKPAP